MISIWKDVVLAREIGASGVDQVHAWKVALAGNLLCAKVLFDSDWVICAAFDCCIVTDHHYFVPLDSANSRNNPTSRHIVLAVQIPTCKLRKLQERRPRVEKTTNAITWQQFSAGKVLCNCLFATSLFHGFEPACQFLQKSLHSRRVFWRCRKITNASEGLGGKLCVRHI